MVNTIELKKEMLDAGYSQRMLSKETKIGVNALNRKINGAVEFTGGEIALVCGCLGITDPARKCEIFLA